MKYIKEYKQYVNESGGKDFEFSIFNIFRPLGRLISNINANSKLANLINDYDKYLYNVYVEYLERKKHLPKAELENSEISVIGQDKKIHVDGINDSENETDTETDKEDEIGKDKEGITTPEVEDNANSVYSSKDAIRNSTYYDEVDSEEFASLIDETVAEKNVTYLKELKQEYIDSLKALTNKQDILKKDNNNYFKERKKILEDILSVEKGTPEYKKLDRKLKPYDTVISDLTDKIKNLASKIGQQKLYLDEVKKAIAYLEKQNVPDEPVLEPVTEANDWTGGAVYDLNWTELDMQKITNLVNPFQIEEYHLKADRVISNSKNPDKFKDKWNMYLNSLYKKWYYTFDVRNLRNQSPNLNNKNFDKKENAIKKDLAYSSLILEELFPNIKSYSYRFKLLGSDKNKYFILLSKNDMLLMKKILFKDNTYSFQFLSVLRPNKDNTNIIATKMLNTLDDKMEIIVNDKKISLYKEEKEYPIFFIHDGDMFTTKDFVEFDSISLKNCNIYSLKDNHFKELIKNSNVHYEDKLPSEETFEKIKKTTLK